MNRKKIIILVVVIAIVILAVLLYFFLPRPESDYQEIIDDTEYSTENTEVIINYNKFEDIEKIDYSSIINIDNTEIDNYTYLHNYIYNDELYSFDILGKIKKEYLTTNNESIIYNNKEVFGNIDDINKFEWSDNGKMSYISYGNESNNTNKNIIIDTVDQKYHELNSSIRYVDWYNNENSILYLYYDLISSYSLNKANFDGSDWYNLEIEDISDNLKSEVEYKISMGPDDKYVLVYSELDVAVANKNSIVLVNIESRDIIEIGDANRININPIWSPDGDRIIYESAGDDLLPELWEYNIATNNTKALDLHGETIRIDFIDNENIIIAMPDKQLSIYMWTLEENTDNLAYALMRYDLESGNTEYLKKLKDIEEIRGVYYSDGSDNLYIINTDNIYTVNNLNQ